MEKEKTIADLVVGDEVALPIGRDEQYSLIKIREISRGVLTLENGERYRQRDGSPLNRGEKWHRRPSIQMVTERIMQVNRKAALVSRLSELDWNAWNKMDIVTLEQITAIIWPKS